ncbi:hypothetical protein Clst_0353 [Thermoclostridium stercorarium subsp. stercorarium DSM 8532]|jgi:hypothetical protein|nr:hypothetical protein Clst_0353 [Thermoclostridium stercorarium subsp. stercorarium DSM 8532]
MIELSIIYKDNPVESGLIMEFKIEHNNFEHD